jgi:hypothetical protein
VQTALLSSAARVLLCGGEERGTWLLEQKVASDRTFAFALALTCEASGAIARVSLDACSADGIFVEFTLPQFFDALRERRGIELVGAPGLQLGLHWL